MHFTRHSAVAKRCSGDRAPISNLIVLSLVLCLTGLTAACGAASQAASGAPNNPAMSAGLRVSPPAAQATVGVPYNSVSSVSGGSAPYFFRITSGSLPPGLVLSATTGSIAGTPPVAGTYNFTLYVTAVGKELIPGAHGANPAENLSGSIPASIAVSASGTSITISPSSANLASQAQQQFTASINGSADTAVTWSASAGTISSTGVFTAPKVTTSTSVTITATSVSHSNTHAAAAATVSPQDSLAVTTSALTGADAGMTYTASLSATGGVTPYQWSLASGSLPSGIQLQSTSGVITGTTSLIGSYPFTAKVTDSAGHNATVNLSLKVSTSSANGFDGPAELPRVYIQSAMANTPAPGSTISVNAGGDLQSALNSAHCGDTIQLQAGATFTGAFTFPAKNCDDNHWIIVRTSSDDSKLPAEGSRLSPCYAGVSSLPGRPSFQCASTSNVLPKLVMAAAGTGPINFASGANYYRIIGLEITRTAGTGGVSALWSVAKGGTANNLVVDRVWMHGTAQDDTTRAIELGGSTYVAIVDSFFTDFHCVSITGSCSDAQTINGGLGDNQMGPYKIVGNFLEASGENILFGGGEATVTPADIEIRQNHMFKPLTWLQGQARYVGGTNGNPFVVKNFLELKNAQRVLVDGNIMENCLGGFSQVGFAILLTPKNQSNLCPSCQVTDVTIRYSSISHVGAGLQIANGLSDSGGSTLDGERYSIHDVIVDDIDGVKYKGPGELAQISVGAGAPVLKNVTINHVTAFAPSTLFIIGDEVGPTPQMSNFIFTNSIVNTGSYPVWSTGSGGSANCAYHDSPITTFNACFSSYTFSADALIAAPPATKWPSGNFFPATTTAVQFVNYKGGIGGDYHLLPSSPYKGLGTDGKDLGADVDAVNSAVAGVQ
jgi:hypothetical protein